MAKLKQTRKKLSMGRSKRITQLLAGRTENTFTERFKKNAAGTKIKIYFKKALHHLENNSVPFAKGNTMNTNARGEAINNMPRRR